MLDVETHASPALSGDRFYQNSRRCDRLFVALLAVQWVSAVGAACFVTHEAGHVWLAIILGTVLACVPLVLIARHPGRTATRHAVAVMQMTISALLIHLTNGSAEAHLFGSLAFLALYRDWRILITATAVISADALYGGLLVGGSLTDAAQRIAWLLFFDLFLVRACLTTERDWAAGAPDLNRLFRSPLRDRAS